MEKRDNVAAYKQFGVTGLRRYGAYIYEEFLPDLRWPWAAKVYQEMADNDPVIGSILYLAEMLIRGTAWDVKPASTSEEDKTAAEFIKQCMDDMESSWADTISEILSMLTYGFSFHEIVYKIRRGPFENDKRYASKYSDGKIGWRKLPIRSQASLKEWQFDKSGDAVAFIQAPEGDYKQYTIPFTKGMLFRTRIQRNNPEGKSLLRNAYRPWYFKKHFEEVEGIGIERDLAGFPVLTAPEGLDLWNPDDAHMVTLKGRAEELVASVRRDSEEGVLLPFGWDLKLLSSTSSRQIPIGETIERYDNRIAITMLSDIILIGSKSGSFALADTKQSLIAAALQAQLMNIADVFNNTAVPMLCKLNNINMEAMPKIIPGNIQTPTLKEVALLLRSMGFTSMEKDMELQNYLRHLLNFPELDKETYEELYEPQEEEPLNPNKPQGADQDTTYNDARMKDEEYVGQ